MPFKSFKNLDLGTISAGGVVEKSWSSDDDYIIKRIYFVEKAAGDLSDVLTTVRIGEVALCKEDVPCRLFGTNLQTAPEIDFPIRKAETIFVAVKNNLTTSVAIYAVLELWKPS